MKAEGLNEQNDTIIIAKRDGGTTIVDDGSTAYGSIHSKKAGIDFKIRSKIPWLGMTRVGHKPEQIGSLYYFNDDGENPYEDPQFMFHELVETYRKHERGTFDDRSKIDKIMQSSFVQIVAVLMGIAMVVYVFVLAPMYGIGLNVNNESDVINPGNQTVIEGPDGKITVTDDTN